MPKISFDLMLPWMYRAIFCSFFLPAKWQTWVIVAFISIVFLFYFQSKIKLEKSAFLLALCLGGSYLFYIGWIFITPLTSRFEIYSLLERKLTYFVFPFTILMLSKMSHYQYKKDLIWFVIANSISVVLANVFIMISLINQVHHAPMNHVFYRIAFEDYTQIHPTYFGMYCCFSLSILWLFGKEFFAKTPWINYLLQIILLSSLLLLLPKAPVVALLLIFVYAMVFLIKLKKLQKVGLTLGACLFLILLYFLVPFVQQRIDEIFSFLQKENTDVIANSMSMRSLLFKTDIALLKQHWLIGIGPVELQNQLNRLLFSASMQVEKSSVIYNTHNEYINQWLSFGLLGLLFFLLILFVHIRKAVQQKNILYSFLILILMVTFFTENVLSRQHGVVFYALFTSLFFFIPLNSFEKQVR